MFEDAATGDETPAKRGGTCDRDRLALEEHARSTAGGWGDAPHEHE
jgi:hypothetical protein